MSWVASDENNFIKNNLSPALSNAGLSPKIIPYDHNWDNTAYPSTLLGDATTRNEHAALEGLRFVFRSPLMRASLFRNSPRPSGSRSRTAPIGSRYAVEY